MNTSGFINVLLAFFLCCTLSYGQSSGYNTDSVFVQFDRKLGKVIYHHPSGFQTLYAIGRIYGVTPESIARANPKVINDTRPPVTRLVIPISDSELRYDKPSYHNKGKYQPVYYRVQKGDNLFQISRKYFDLPTRVLVERNQLASRSISPGDALLIGWITKDQSSLVVLEGDLMDPFGGDPEMARLFDLQDVPMMETNEVAFWKKGAHSRGFLVMHRHAPAHSIIEIINPLFGKKIYAKVLGKIPDNLYPAEVDMVLSTEAARQLNAIDQKFFFRSRYPRDTQSASR